MWQNWAFGLNILWNDGYVSRDVVTVQTQRLPPDKWSKFALSSLFINSYNFNQTSSIIQHMSTNFYSKRRKPGFIYAYDSSKTKIGKQITKNWIGHALCCLEFPWSDRTLSKDAIRIALKKSYYGSLSQSTWWTKHLLNQLCKWTLVYLEHWTLNLI